MEQFQVRVHQVLIQSNFAHADYFVQEGKSVQYDWEHEYPNTFEEACEFIQHSHEAIAITEGIQPFIIIDINDFWIELCGYPREEVIGRSFRFMQGALTSSMILDQIIAHVNQGLSFETTLINYKKSGIPFQNLLRIKPLRVPGSFENPAPITHYFATLREMHPV